MRGGYRANAGGWNRQSMIDHLRYDLATGCWNWTGDTDTFGYGRMTFMGRRMNVHRVSAILWLGLELRDNRFVLHRCDNPKCFSPKHLYLGTQQDNVNDMLKRKGHYRSLRTHCKNGHPFAECSKVYTMNGRPYRRCMVCARKNSK